MIKALLLVISLLIRLTGCDDDSIEVSAPVISASEAHIPDCNEEADGEEICIVELRPDQDETDYSDEVCNH